MMLIMLATILTGAFIGAFFGWMDVENYWKDDVDGTSAHMVASLFTGALFGLGVGAVICGTMALVRYFVL